jgi:hypothetical protein
MEKVMEDSSSNEDAYFSWLNCVGHKIEQTFRSFNISNPNLPTLFQIHATKGDSTWR